MAGRESLGPRSIAGRTGETAVVLAVVRDAVQGRSSTLLICGEAGVGKTSLLGDIAVDGVEVIRVTRRVVRADRFSQVDFRLDARSGRICS
jgi:Cdc6-like AAA superfamily ATPase